MKTLRICNLAALALLALGAFAQTATIPADMSSHPAPRTPRGIYAVVNVDEYANDPAYQTANTSAGGLEPFLRGNYKDLLDNADVSGIALYEIWAPGSIRMLPDHLARSCGRSPTTGV